MLLNTKRLTPRGDTIVEVMIVLAVLGLAISISYATANRSLLNTRQAQENSQATELLQSQLEALRYMSANPISNGPYYNPADNPNPSIFSTTDRLFCIDTSNYSPYYLNRTIDNNPSDYDIYPAGTDMNPDPCLPPGGLYHIAIAYCPPPNPNPNVNTGLCTNLGPNGNQAYDSFVAQATWYDVSGQGKDTVTLIYRLHPAAGGT